MLHTLVGDMLVYSVDRLLDRPYIRVHGGARRVGAGWGVRKEGTGNDGCARSMITYDPTSFMTALLVPHAAAPRTLSPRLTAGLYWSHAYSHRDPSYVLGGV